MSKSELSPNAITQTVFDEESSAYRVILQATGMAIEVDADDGDSIQVQPRAMSQELSINEAIDVEKCSSARIYVKSIGAGDASLKLQISPLDSGDFWVDALSISPGANANDCIVSSVIDKLIAKRAKVIKVSGTQDLQIMFVGRGN